jgi:hypothetical protein
MYRLAPTLSIHTAYGLFIEAVRAAPLSPLEIATPFPIKSNKNHGFVTFMTEGTEVG